MIRKTLILVSGTVTGLVGVLAYNPPSLDNQLTNATSSSGANTQPPSASVKPTESPVASPKPKSSKVKSVTKPQTKSEPQPQTESASPTPSAEKASPAESKSSGTFDGNISQTRYGPLQVRIEVSNGKIVNVDALSFPSRDMRSVQISQQMIPWLIQETLNKQSTSIMNVSGATITSNAWKSSLASALQKAGL